ncbi:MAG: NADH-quinone oxidoreductase subunit NuoG [Deltaproteobacteria bacterium]|nr:NADH-quinone oxidoreductase subunit NuoG [Deltaproteobacteria bacterium]MCL4873774.1 NADH-quinone oxidoreductase subunit NuoG [bacterium]
MPKIYVDGKECEAAEGQNLLEACLGLGFDLPYFCWHPAMRSVGACRQCAVKEFKDENDARGRIVMACMTPVTEGARISIDDPEARAFRAGVIEWLMASHPHDCPVCDEGGECHLQDMTVMAGHVYRRHRFGKRTYRNQDLGPFVNHEMNRCIQCYRCVRFYCDYAGGRDLSVFASRDSVYFGRSEDGTLESEFSGNLVEVCPTGVFTDKTLKKHYTRKWDLQAAPSICVHCGLGCNTTPGERYGRLRRIRNRYNGSVNGYFLCDRGRFGYEFVNGDKRIRRPVLRERPGEEEQIDAGEAIRRASLMLGDGKRVMAIGSPRASLESNFALRELAGPENFFSGLPDNEHKLLRLVLDILKGGPARSPSLSEVGRADAVLILGEDVTNTAPVEALMLRQAARKRPVEKAVSRKIPEWDASAIKTAIQNEKEPFHVAAPFATKLDEAAKAVYHAPPEDIARLGNAIAHELDRDAPSPEGLEGRIAQLAKDIAEDLKDAKSPIIVSGVSLSEAVVKAAANVAWALEAIGKKAALSYIVPECNSTGLALMGGKSLDDALKAAAHGGFDTLVILENDLFTRAGKEEVEVFFECFENIIAIDHTATRTTSAAGLVFPAAAFAEGTGTLVNSEGRAQRFFKVFDPEGDIAEGWRWLGRIMEESGAGTAWSNIDEVLESMASEVPELQEAIDAAPSAGLRMAGQKVARAPQRFSGRTAIHAGRSVIEPRPPEDPDSPLSFSMEGFQPKGLGKEPPPELIPQFWSPGWNSPQAVIRFQDGTNGGLRGNDPGVRLINPAEAMPGYFREVPGPFRPRKGEWLVIPVYHIFGSEELNALSPPVAGLIPRPYIGLNPEDAVKLEAPPGEEVALKAGGLHLKLPARHMPGLPEGVAALPVLPGVERLRLPQWGVVARPKESAA